MAIPEAQLQTWSHQGAVTTASDTNSAIHNALHAQNSPIRDRDFNVYLQGSYKNDTNIRGDSDVDIVVQLNSKKNDLGKPWCQATVFRYWHGLTRDGLCHILDLKDGYGTNFPGETFCVLKEKEEREYREYRTRRLVLEAWDRLWQGFALHR